MILLLLQQLIWICTFFSWNLLLWLQRFSSDFKVCKATALLKFCWTSYDRVYFAPNARNGASSSIGTSSGRSFRHTPNLSGLIVTPAFPTSDGSSAPCGNDMSKRCMIDEKNENNSIRARTFPKHILLPTPKGMKYSGFWTFPSAFIKRLGLNFSGLSHKFGSMWTVLMSGTTWHPALGRQTKY